METPPKNYYFDKLSGCVESDPKLAVDHSIENAASDLFYLLKKEDQNYVDNADYFIENTQDVLSAMETLKSVLNNHMAFIKTYNLKK